MVPIMTADHLFLVMKIVSYWTENVTDLEMSFLIQFQKQMVSLFQKMNLTLFPVTLMVAWFC